MSPHWWIEGPVILECLQWVWHGILLCWQRPESRMCCMDGISRTNCCILSLLCNTGRHIGGANMAPLECLLYPKSLDVENINQA